MSTPPKLPVSQRITRRTYGYALSPHDEKSTANANPSEEGKQRSSSELPLDESLTPSYRPGMGKFLGRYWGYIALALAIAGWFTHTVGYVAILIVSLLALVYFLVQAPLTCGAEDAMARAGTTLKAS